MSNINGEEHTKLKLDQIVIATRVITEGGNGEPNPNAKFPESNYIHANAGDFGWVEGIDDGTATVRFYPSGTATIVGDIEVRVADAEELKSRLAVRMLAVVEEAKAATTHSLKEGLASYIGAPPDKRHQLSHPLQPLGEDGMGVIRFKENKIVSALLETSPMDLNEIGMGVHRGRFSNEDQIQLAQLIGYSHCGFGDLSYVDDETVAAARTMYEDGCGELEARLEYCERLIKTLRVGLREPVAELFGIHPDDLVEVEDEEES